MKIEKNMFQTKKHQDKTPEKELHETEVSCLLDKEFKVTVMKMLIQLCRETKELSQNFSDLNKDLNILRKDITQLKNITVEMKKSQQGINRKSDDTEEWTSNQEDRIVEVPQLEGQKEKRMKKNEDSIRDLWDNIKHTNIRIIRVPEGGDRKKGTENLFEKIMAENFPNLAKETDIQVQEAHSPK